MWQMVFNLILFYINIVSEHKKDNINSLKIVIVYVQIQFTKVDIYIMERLLFTKCI